MCVFVYTCVWSVIAAKVKQPRLLTGIRSKYLRLGGVFQLSLSGSRLKPAKIYPRLGAVHTEHVQNSLAINEEAPALFIPYMGVEIIDFWSGTNHIKEREEE